MNSALYGNKPDLKALLAAFSANAGDDALGRLVSAPQWDVLAEYMQPFSLPQSRVLIEQGAPDRTLYFLEEGSLTVHYEDASGRIHLAILGAGSAVGEGGFFSRQPRSATVQAASACKLWSLTPMRFTELSNRHPMVALALAMALGSVISTRLLNQRKRVAIT